jgi:hypothetical protein
VKRKPGKPEDNPRGDRRSYQDDPRYKAFYDKLKQSQRQPSQYDEEVEAKPVSELDETDWDDSPRAQASRRVKPPQPPPAPASAPPSRRPAASAAGDDLQMGTIMCFDDGSLAIYKDAVSGKDYALFYFLEPDGTVAPRGIFLEQYDKMRIGLLSREAFADMIAQGRWDRDVVIFHLDSYEHIAKVRALEQRTPSRPRPAYTPPPAPAAAPAQPEAPPEPAPPHHREPEPAPVHYHRRLEPRDTLERGRVLRLRIGGNVWEAVYWTTDEIGAIVAHDTNKEWALMHLDLNRFKDAIEYGELLSWERLQEIERTLAQRSA